MADAKALVANAIRFHRAARGWTLADLGERTGVSIATVHRWERGLSLTLDVVDLVAKALGIHPFELFVWRELVPLEEVD